MDDDARIDDMAALKSLVLAAGRPPAAAAAPAGALAPRGPRPVVASFEGSGARTSLFPGWSGDSKENAAAP